jgi:hypothetical protein
MNLQLGIATALAAMGKQNTMFRSGGKITTNFKTIIPTVRTMINVLQ